MKNLLLFLFFTATTISHAQQLEPVKWEQKVEKQEDGTYKVDFIASVEEGWYIYSQNLEEGGPIPTSIEFLGKGIEIVEETKEIGDLKEGFDDMFEIDIRKYAENVVFSTIIKPLHSKVTKTTASVRFMCCDNKRCLPPTSVDFDVPLK